jgi:hypothetical protein
VGILAPLLPNNPLVFAEGGLAWLRQDGRRSAGRPVNQVAALRSHYPDSYLARAASCYSKRAANDLGAARLDAEGAVTSSRANPDAWLLLASTIGDQANILRQGRSPDEMSRPEMESLERFYGDQLPVTMRGTLLDPTASGGWVILSQVAANVGATDLADKSLWKGIEVGPQDSVAYQWGLELYQPKWQGNARKLRLVGEKAVQVAEKWPAHITRSLALHARQAHLEDIATQLDQAADRH